MEDEDFLRIEAALRRLAELVGAGDVMDPRHYRDPADLPPGRDGKPERGRPFSPRERLVAEVKALERHLALLDRNTYEKTLAMMRDAVANADSLAASGSLPEEAVIEMDDERARGVRALFFSELPDLGEARHLLRGLAAGLAEA